METRRGKAAMAGALVALALLFAAGLEIGRRDLAAKRPGVFELDRAWARVKADPRDPAAWAAFGDAQAALDLGSSAEQSYETALRLGGAKDGSIHARLGFLLYGRGDDARALEMLLAARRLGATEPMLGWTIEQIEERATVAAAPPPPETPRPPVHGPRDEALRESAAGGRPDASSSVETDASAPIAAPAGLSERDRGDRLCSLELTRMEGVGTHRVPVEVAGVGASLVFDTGASITAISEELLRRTALHAEPDRRIQVITAAGRIEMAIATIPAITIGGRRASDVRVAICDACAGPEADGLLGLDLQASLGLELDLKNRRISFSDCSP